MTYTPINWQNGDTITAEKMNKMDNGWGVSSTQLFSETVTTTAGEMGNVAQLDYSSAIDVDMLSVTFDGVEYECARMEFYDNNVYGGFDTSGEGNPDFTEYPFFIVSSESNMIFTENEGIYTVAASSLSVENSVEFEMAVKSVLGSDSIPMACESGITTADEMESARQKGRMMYFYANARCYFITESSILTSNVAFIPESQTVNASFVNGVFTVTAS